MKALFTPDPNHFLFLCYLRHHGSPKPPPSGDWSLGAILSSSLLALSSPPESIIMPHLPHLLSIFCLSALSSLFLLPHWHCSSSRYPSFNSSSSFLSLYPFPLTPSLSAHSDIDVILSTALKTSVPPKCPLTEEWIKDRAHCGTMKYYSAVKKNKIMPSAVTWMDLETGMLSEVRQREEILYHIPYVESKGACTNNIFTKQKQIHRQTYG